MIYQSRFCHIIVYLLTADAEIISKLDAYKLQFHLYVTSLISWGADRIRICGLQAAQCSNHSSTTAPRLDTTTTKHQCLV